MNESTREALRALPTVKMSVLLPVLGEFHRIHWAGATDPTTTWVSTEDLERDFERIRQAPAPPPPIRKSRAQVRDLMPLLAAQHEKTFAVLITLEWHALTVEALTARLDQQGIDRARERAVAYDEARAISHACRRQSVHAVAQLMGLVLVDA